MPRDEVNVDIYHGCHRSGNDQGKKFFKVREKSVNFTSSQGRLKSLVEVREKFFPLLLLILLFLTCKILFYILRT